MLIKKTYPFQKVFIKRTQKASNLQRRLCKGKESLTGMG